MPARLLRVRAFRERATAVGPGDPIAVVLSAIIPTAIAQRSNGAMLGYSEVSERARQRVDDEMHRIVLEAHEDAVQLLSENRHRLDGLAEALFQAETLDRPEAYGAAGLEPSGDYATQASAPGEAPPSRPSVSIPRRGHT